DDLNPEIVIDYAEEQFPQVLDWLEGHDLGTEELRKEIEKGSLTLAQTIGNRALSYSGSLLNFFIQFSLMLYLLFFFFRDGMELVRAVTNAIPMGNFEREGFLNASPR
ncbi:MAG: hypothetical protein AAFU03_16305, partial [Bacteroidota bacterium]